MIRRAHGRGQSSWGVRARWCSRLSCGVVAMWMLLGCESGQMSSPVPAGRCDMWIDQAPTGATSEFSIVVMPDTQFYAERYPDTFHSQTAWIADAKQEQQIAFVLHEGDIVNTNVQEQWSVASQALHALDGVVPYVLAVGNHDVRIGGSGLTRDADLFNEHFPVAMHDDDAWFCGSYAPDDQQNTYALLDGGGRKWLVIALEFGPRDEVLAWANDVLSDFSAYPAIIVTHAYMYLEDDRYDHVGMPEQQYSPHSYGIAGSVNDGEEMWNALVAPNSNVKLVFSGHMLWPGVGRLESTRADGSSVHQVLANYQACPGAVPCNDPNTGQMIQGGDGYLRIVHFNGDHSVASVTSYSTTLDTYLRHPDHEFTLSLDPE